MTSSDVTSSDVTSSDVTSAGRSSKRLETRSRILAAGLELLESKGGVGVRMADVAKAAGISRQAVYLHFASRTDLLVAITYYVDEVLETDRRYQVVRATTTATDHLLALIKFWSDHVPGIYGVAKALMADLDTDEAAKVAWEDRMSAVRSACAAAILVIEAEAKLDSSWNLDSATDFLASLLAIRTWEQLTIQNGWTAEQYVERQFHVAQRALFAP